MTWTILIWLAQALFDLCVWVLLAWLFITGRYDGRHSPPSRDR